MALAALVGAAYSLIGLGRRHISDRAVLIAAALSVTLMPYVLPKMHDRYFLGADLFAYALACVDRRFIWAAVAMQISSLLAYAPEFSLHFLPGDYHVWRWGVVAGAIINLGVIVHLAMSLKEELGVLWDVEGAKSRLYGALDRWRATGMFGG
jgi:cytosine/uracil/thiamine/allantoin permease